MENTNIQTRPISELPEMTKDSKTTQFLMFDEEDQTAKRMPRSAAPVFVNGVLHVTEQNDSEPIITIESISHTPDEIRALLVSNTPISSVTQVDWYYEDSRDSRYVLATNLTQVLEEDWTVKGLELYVPFGIWGIDIGIHAVDGSNTWEVGFLPQIAPT